MSGSRHMVTGVVGVSLLALASGAPQRAAAATSACDSIAGNLITNCGFETPAVGSLGYIIYTTGPTTNNLPGWTEDAGYGQVASPATANGGYPPHTGNQSYLFYSGYQQGSSLANVIHQDIATTAGHTYTLSFYLNSVINGAAASVTAAAGTTSQTFTDPGSGYILETLSFVASGSTTRIQFTEGTASPQIDDVSVVETTTTCTDPSCGPTYGQAPLTITANDRQMTYGGAVPVFDASYSGLVNGDTSGVVSGLVCGATDGHGTPVTSGTPAGSYPITCAGASAANYTISYQPGTLTISPASLTITASSPSVVYNGTVPAITPGYSGFVNGDGPASLTTAPTCASTAPASGAAGTYTTSCTGAVDPNYSITYGGGTLTITQAPQALSFTSTPPSPARVGATYTAAATGGASGNPVTFSAGPSTVCTSGGANGATITLVGAGTCTVTASQAGNGNYSAAAPATQSVAVSYPPLSLTLGVASSPAGPVTTGSVVTVTGTLSNHSAAAEKVTLTATFSYVSLSGQRLIISATSRAFTLAAGQTVGQPFSFTIGKSFPRGSYTVALTATDTAGDTSSGSASLTVV